MAPQQSAVIVGGGLIGIELGRNAASRNILYFFGTRKELETVFCLWRKPNDQSSYSEHHRFTFGDKFNSILMKNGHVKS
jgi:hypothetical protein